MEVSGQLHAPAALRPGKELPVSTGWDIKINLQVVPRLKIRGAISPLPDMSSWVGT